MKRLWLEDVLADAICDAFFRILAHTEDNPEATIEAFLRAEQSTWETWLIEYARQVVHERFECSYDKIVAAKPQKRCEVCGRGEPFDYNF